MQSIFTQRIMKMNHVFELLENKPNPSTSLRTGQSQFQRQKNTAMFSLATARYAETSVTSFDSAKSLPLACRRDGVCGYKLDVE